ncbi:MAG: (2Fe-2S) ferredoxin domain-containing protein [Pseudobdellovibrionaceae bacterium]
MKKENNPWTKGVVLICTKCHKSITNLHDEGNAGENLKTFLKKSFKESGDSEKIRVVTSSCLNVCIDEKQAVSYAPIDGQTETFTLNPESERDELLQLLQKRLKGKV